MMNLTKGVELRERLHELSAGRWRTAVRMVDTSLICPSPFHAPVKFNEEEMQALAAKYQREGMNSPLTIRAVGTAHHPMFHLVSGEKRFRACLLGEVTPVPCVILDADPDRLAETGEVPLPRNYFEEADVLFDILCGGGLTEKQLAEKLDIPLLTLQKRLSCRLFSASERKTLLRAGISADCAAKLSDFNTDNRREFYRAIQNGVTGKDAEELLSPPKRKEKVIIKDIRLFYNTIDKAISIMRKSGVDIAFKREDGDSTTKLTISVPH